MYIYASNQPQQTGFLHNGWALIVAVGVIVGLLAGIQQLGSWLNRRGQRRAEERVLEIVEHQLDAEKAKQDAEHYERLRTELRTQIEQEVPKEARRAYLLNRMDRLAENLSNDLLEYETIEQELQTISAAPASPLDERVRTVVRGSVLPSQEQRRRRERWIFALLVALLVLSFSPAAPGYLVQSYFDILGNSALYTTITIVTELIIGTIVLTILARISSFLLKNRLSGRLRRSINKFRLLTLMGPPLGLGLIIWGFFWHSRATYLYYESRDRYSADLYAGLTFHLGVILIAAGTATAYGAARRMMKARHQ